MLEKVCFFNYNIFVPDFHSPIRDASIVAFEYARNERNQLFKECSKIKIPYLKDFHPKQVYLDTVENYITGLKCLIVVILSEDKITTLMYCKTLRNGLFYMQMLPLPSHQTEKNVNLFVTDGPMVILLSDNEMTFHSICRKTKNSLDLSSYCENNQCQILQCSGIGQLMEINYDSILFISLAFIDDHNKNHIEILVVAINTLDSFTTVMHHSVPQKYFFPEAFISSVQSLCITNLSTNCYARLQSKESPIKILASLNKLFKSNHSYVCTSENFLIFHNAELVYVCDLPHLNMHWDIRVDLWESSDSPFSALLVSKDQDVYLIKKSPFSDKLQVTKSWEGIDCILTGSIKADDTKKLLMLRDCSFSSWQEEIVFCDITCDVTMDLMNQSDIPSAAIEKTIPGIKSNVEAGNSAVAEAEWEISQKIGATLDALYKIKNEVPKKNAVAQQILSFQETLLDILINPNGKCEKKDPMEHNELIYFKKHQTHFIGHRVILCLEFSNIDKRPFCHPSMKIFVENQSLNCVQKVFVRRKGIEFLDEDEDEYRQIIHPNEEFYILVNLKIPQFVSEILQIKGILSGSFGFSQDNLLPLQAEAFYHLQKPLQISICPSLWEELKDISLRNELKYFRIIQDRTVFSVSALKSKLSDIEIYLTPPLGSESKPPLFISNVRPDSSKTTQVFVNVSSELYGASVTFQESKKYGLEIEAFTRTDIEAFLLVKMMYCNLESDFLILPIGVSSSEHEELKHKAVRAMKEEVDFLLSAIDINSRIQSSNEQEKNRITRKQFLKMRSFATRKEAITDNIMQDLYTIYSLTTNV